MNKTSVYIVLSFFLMLAVSNISISAVGATPKVLVPLHMCVWDPIGKSGPAEQIMREAKIYAFKWGWT